jgi:hypothetical protein
MMNLLPAATTSAMDRQHPDERQIGISDLLKIKLWTQHREKSSRMIVLTAPWKEVAAKNDRPSPGIVDETTIRLRIVVEVWFATGGLRLPPATT